LKVFNIGQCVSAIRAGVVRHSDGGTTISDSVAGHVAGKNSGIVTCTAVDRVVSSIAF